MYQFDTTTYKTKLYKANFKNNNHHQKNPSYIASIAFHYGYLLNQFSTRDI